MASTTSQLSQELQIIYTESKRRYPEIREAADHAIGALKILPPTYQLGKDKQRIETILAPLLLSCQINHAKIGGSAVSCLQKLVSLGAFGDADDDLKKIVGGLEQVATISGAVDIQLRVLQILLQLVTKIQGIHDALLLDILVICFRLHELNVSVVSSTAAATLRQLVVVLFDKVELEDQKSKLNPSPIPLTDFVVQLDIRANDKEQADIVLSPAAKDAYQIFHDLCLLTNGDHPKYIRLKTLTKPFGLELIESIISNHSNLFKLHSELVQLLRQAVCPMLLKQLSEKCSFPLRLRSTRVAYLLIKQHTENLSMECEIFMNLLLKSTESGKDIWQRAISMEVMRGICADPGLIARLWTLFDAVPASTDLLSNMISTFNKVGTEKPGLLGTAPKAANAIMLQPDAGMSGIMEAATMGTMSMIPQTDAQVPGLSKTSVMKVQCIDQLDKVEPPLVPETYIQYLALTNLSTLITSVTESTAGTEQNVVRQIVEVAWPGLLASLTFYLSTNLSQDLFTTTLDSFRLFLQKAGQLDLIVARDAFLTSLSKIAIPAEAVSRLLGTPDFGEPKTPGLGPGSQSTLSPLSMANTILSQRNLAALTILLQVTTDLASSLEDTWLLVLETLQNAEMIFTAVLDAGNSKIRSRGESLAISRSDQQAPTTAERTDQLAIAEEDLIQARDNVNRVFEDSVHLDTNALRSFVQGLCQLAAAMVGMPSETCEEKTSGTISPLASSTKEISLSNQNLPMSLAIRRRASGALVLRTLRVDEKLYVLTKLSRVAEINFDRLVLPESPEDDCWQYLSRELVAIMSFSGTPTSIQSQSAQVLQSVILGIAKFALGENSLADQVLIRLLQSLKSIIEFRASDASSHDHKIRESGLLTLNHLIESCGQALSQGWSIIFSMLRSVTCATVDLEPNHSPRGRTMSSTSISTSALAPYRSLILMRSAFPTMQLICSDFLTSLSDTEMEDCIYTLTTFAKQVDDLNMAITASNLLWTVSDSIRERSTDQETKDSLWISSLAQLASLARDERSDVRNGAAQIIYRSINAHGSQLTNAVWEKLLYEILFPLLDDTDVTYERTAHEWQKSKSHGRQPSPVRKWSETKMLLSSGIINTIKDSLAQLVSSPAFEEAWAILLRHYKRSLVSGDSQIATSASQSIEVFLNHSSLPESCRAGIEEMWHDAAKESKSSPPSVEISQEALTSMINLATSIRRLTSAASQEHLQHTMDFLEFAARYPYSPNYRPDVDHLTPCQASLINYLKSVKGRTYEQVKATLALYVTFIRLPFDVKEVKTTYVALCKASMSHAEALYADIGHVDQGPYLEILIELCQAYGHVIATKYDCPPASKYGDDPPLWQTAIVKFVGLIETASVPHAPTDQPFALIETIQQVVKTGLLADCEKAKLLSAAERDRDEELSMKLLDLWKSHVYSYLGSGNTGDQSLILDAAQTLQEASRLYRLDITGDVGKTFAHAKDVRFTDDFGLIADSEEVQGTLCGIKRMTNERLRLTCLDELFALCQLGTSSALGNGDSHERSKDLLASEIALPIFSQRVKYVLKTYLADTDLHGRSSLPRIRQVEMIEILRLQQALRPPDRRTNDLSLSLIQRLTSKGPRINYEGAILEATAQLVG